MEKRMMVKRTVSVLLIVVLTLLVLPTAIFGEEFIEINETNFPDPIFRKHIKKNFDADNDDKLSVSEISGVKDMYVKEMGIKSLVGIKHFTKLTDLNCNGNPLKTLDVSGLSELLVLECANCELTELNLEGLISLVGLDCDNNKLLEIDTKYTAYLFMWGDGTQDGGEVIAEEVGDHYEINLAKAFPGINLKNIDSVDAEFDVAEHYSYDPETHIIKINASVGKQGECFYLYGKTNSLVVHLKWRLAAEAPIQPTETEPSETTPVEDEDKTTTTDAVVAPISTTPKTTVKKTTTKKISDIPATGEAMSLYVVSALFIIIAISLVVTIRKMKQADC